MIRNEVQIFRGLEEWRSQRRPSVIAVGTFDGVHLGHKALVRHAIEGARATGDLAVVLTFEPHPGEVLRQESSNRLSTPAEKMDYLVGLGPDIILVLDFQEDLRTLSAEKFAQSILAELLHGCHVHVGFNFHFGSGGEGNVHRLTEFGQKYNFAVDVLKAVEHGGKPISSSRIRQALKDGDVATARFFLGREYTFAGSVVRGEGRGKDLGFPTANLELFDSRKLLPRFGVYLGHVCGELTAPCLVSIGLSPTFGPREQARIEVYIPEHDGGELYDCQLQVSLTEWMRPELRFERSEQLVEQMKKDLEYLYSRTGKEALTCRSSMQECVSNE